MRPYVVLSVENSAFCLLTAASYPAHLRKKPASAPDALMVSAMLMPASVVEPSLAASLICTRIMFTFLSVR
jgi:hypothetical protein